jgi:hypothetical protein
MKNTEAAFRWIVGILNDHKIPFEISGGFAARMYGATRDLADIDLDIPEENFQDILPEVKKHIVFGPARYRDDNWDLFLMTLRYLGQDIDIAGAKARMLDQNTRKWVALNADFSRTTPLEIYGLRVPVANKEDLIAYKRMLGREVDNIDIEQMTKNNKF